MRLSTTRQRYGGDASMLDNWRMWAVPDLCFRSVREDASCTRFSASDALPTSQRARACCWRPKAVAPSGRSSFFCHCWTEATRTLHRARRPAILSPTNQQIPAIAIKCPKKSSVREYSPSTSGPGASSEFQPIEESRVEQPLRRRRSAVPKNARGAKHFVITSCVETIDGSPAGGGRS